MNILITGASGFVGRRLVERLRPTYPGLVAAVRQSPAPGETAVGDIRADTDWSSVLCGRQCVIHTAARVHVMRDETADPLAAYRRVNVAKARNLLGWEPPVSVEEGLKRCVK